MSVMFRVMEKINVRHTVSDHAFFLFVLCFVYVIATGNASLKMIMSFFPGADEIPPMGYPHEPELNFNNTSPYPTASTCALQLTLPTCYNEYCAYQSAMNTALFMHGGFGLS